jgi:hypothetical protein
MIGMVFRLNHGSHMASGTSAGTPATMVMIT